MNRQKVKFISPDNNIYTINYENVEQFCKEICLNETNKQKFEEFKKDYSYFTPYFDFVMFDLNYIFINPFFYVNQGLFHLGESLYLYPVKDLNYKACFDEAKKLFDNCYPIPFMTNVSDSKLSINKSNYIDTKDVMIDPNLYGMMSKSGTVNGSHVVTSNSILNQLLIKSASICDSFYNFSIDNLDYSIDSINYIINYLGFIRATSANTSAILIGNNSVLENEQKNFIENCKNNNYSYYDLENTNCNSYIKTYKNIVKKH